MPRRGVSIAGDRDTLVVGVGSCNSLRVGVLFASHRVVVRAFVYPMDDVDGPSRFGAFLLEGRGVVPLSSMKVSDIRRRRCCVIFKTLSLGSSLRSVLLRVASLMSGTLSLTRVARRCSRWLRKQMFVKVLGDLFALKGSFVSRTRRSVRRARNIHVLRRRVHSTGTRLSGTKGSHISLLTQIGLDRSGLGSLHRHGTDLRTHTLRTLDGGIGPSLVGRITRRVTHLRGLVATRRRILSGLRISHSNIRGTIATATRHVTRFRRRVRIIGTARTVRHTRRTMAASAINTSSDISATTRSLGHLRAHRTRHRTHLSTTTRLRGITSNHSLSRGLTRTKVNNDGGDDTRSMLTELRHRRNRWFFYRPRYGTNGCFGSGVYLIFSDIYLTEVVDLLSLTIH